MMRYFPKKFQSQIAFYRIDDGIWQEPEYASENLLASRAEKKKQVRVEVVMNF